MWQFPVCLTLSEEKRVQADQNPSFLLTATVERGLLRRVKLEARSVLFTLGTRVFFSRATRSFVGRRPKARAAGHFKNLTETGNRA